MPNLQTLTYLAYLGALAATLLLAALLTPASWWKRPNLLAACVLAGGTWGLGGLALQWIATGKNPLVASAKAMPTIAIAATAAPVPSLSAATGESQRFVTHHDLNLRNGASTAATRLAVVPAGTIVTTTGQRSGDWWQVSATIGKAAMTGWTNSLWLRREVEAANTALPAQHTSG